MMDELQIHIANAAQHMRSRLDVLMADATTRGQQAVAAAQAEAERLKDEARAAWRRELGALHAQLDSLAQQAVAPVEQSVAVPVAQPPAIVISLAPPGAEPPPAEKPAGGFMDAIRGKLRDGGLPA